MVRLIVLEAKLLKWQVSKAGPDHGRKMPDGTMQWGGFDVDTFHYVDNLIDADGISFLCPKCRTHTVHIYFEGRNTPSHLGKNSKGKTVRWAVEGTCLDNLILRPSILIEVGCEWHGWVGCNGAEPGHAI